MDGPFFFMNLNNIAKYSCLTFACRNKVSPPDEQTNVMINRGSVRLQSHTSFLEQVYQVECHCTVLIIWAQHGWNIKSHIHFNRVVCTDVNQEKLFTVINISHGPSHHLSFCEIICNKRQSKALSQSSHSWCLISELTWSTLGVIYRQIIWYSWDNFVISNEMICNKRQSKALSQFSNAWCFESEQLTWCTPEWFIGKLSQDDNY